MFRLAHMWRLKIVQHGSLYRTSRQLQCGVNSEIIDYALRATKEVLLRDKPAQVASFNRVKLRPSSPLIDEIPLSQIVMHVDLADETPLLLRDLSPTLLECVETVIEGGGLEAKGALSAAVANLKSGLNRLVNPEGQFGLSDYTLKALGSASKMLETDANVKIVAEILLPLMKGYCVFNMHHRKALEAHTIKNRMFLPPSHHWNGLAIGNPKLWFGELDMLLCPHIGILQEPGKCAVQGNIFNVELKTCSSHHKIMVYSDYKTQLSHQTARFFSLPTGTKLSWRHSIMMEKVKPATKREFLPPLIL